MPKFPQLSKRPSKLHVWEMVDEVSGKYHEHCLRCGTRFNPNGMDCRAAFYCYPKPEWLKEHPDDDREEF